MLDTFWLIIVTLAFGGVVAKDGAIERLVAPVLAAVKSNGGLVAATVGSTVATNVVTADQYIAIVLPGRMFNAAFRKRGLAPVVLSRSLGDSARVTCDGGECSLHVRRTVHDRVPAVHDRRCAAPLRGEPRLACFDEAIGAAVRGATDAGAAGDLAQASVPVEAAVGTTAQPAAPGEAVAAPAAQEPARPGLLIETAWGFLPDSRKAYVRLHQPNYILFARYTNEVNREPYEPLFDQFADEYDFEDLEAKFQLSVKGRLLTSENRRWGLWFAYTQQSQSQVCSDDISRPFRETHYMPELFGSFRPDIDLGGLKFNLLSLGYTHQSNGRADPISRSWDRLFVEGGLDSERFALMGRGNLGTGKGAAQFSWTSRPILGPLRVHFQLFSGYGESLIDYDWNQTTAGLGVSLNDLL